MIEFGDLFDANLNPVTDPIYKPLEKEFKALFNEFSKEDADEQEHPDEQKCHSEQNHPDAQDKYDERISQYRSVVPDSSNLKEELISFFENEGIAEDLSSDKDSLSSTLPPPLAALSMSYINLLMTPLAPVYTIDNFIQNLCFLNNPDCPVVIQQTSAFWDDIFNALIFNLNYENRESLNTSDDSIALHTLYTLYESSVGESICHSIIPESNWTTNFCQYSMSAFFTYDATHQLPDRSYARSRPFYSVFNTLHEDSSKARTFRNVLNAISCSENLTPRAEDQTLEFRYKQDEWRAGPPKTESSYRTIPLTDTAYGILREIYDTREYRNESNGLSTVLTFMDRKTGQKRKLVMRDLVFINWRTGMPAKNSSYDTHLYKLCDEAGIKRFCMHALRHTYATRAIESGMQPKVLQKLLGHASSKTTMDRYVHVTDDSMQKAVAQFAKAQEAQKG